MIGRGSAEPRRVGGIALVAALAGALGSPSAAALATPAATAAVEATASPAVQTRRLTITFFDARYQVGRDGDVEVEERITVRFEGSWNGIYRFIPVRYRLDDGRGHRISFDFRSVTDDSGNPLRHELDRQGALVKITTWVPGARDAERTIVYRYRVGNALRHFEDEDGLGWAHDELYWNATGDEWEMPILRARATVELPSAVTGVRAVAYTGGYGSRGSDYREQVSGSTVSFETTRQLNLREGFTVVVGWDPGVVARPPITSKLRRLFLDYLFLPIPIVAFALMLSLWRRKGRDPELGRSVMPQYEPPEEMSPAEVGTLMDFSVDPRDLSATILDLAIRGYLRIEEVPGRRRNRPKDHIIHVLKDPTGAGGLKEFELEALEGLWELAEPGNGAGSARSVRVSELKREFYRYVPKIKRKIYSRLTRSPKLFTGRPENVQGAWVGIGIVIAALAVALGIFATNQDLGRPAIRWGSLIATPLVVIGFGLFMPARTLKGAWILNHVLGLREYIDRVDRHRLKYATLEHFETLLPFAAALGLEQKWTEAFEAIIIEPPRWYTSAYPSHFHMHGFSRSLGRMTAATGTALVTAPRSASGGSGFGGGGGGGFSGGGFGGGGGGGF